MSRIERINQVVKEEISNILSRELKDPRLKFVTITSVNVARDLRYAKVYFSVLGNAAQVEAVQQGLDSARGFVRRLIGQRVRMRYTPEIEFVFDRSLEYSIQIEQALERIKDDDESHSAGDKKE